MTDILILLVINILVVAAWLQLWFDSTLPILVTLLVRRVLRKTRWSPPEEFWQKEDPLPGETIDIWTRQDWNGWLQFQASGRFPKLAHLLQCSRCLGFHMGYLVASMVAVLTIGMVPLRVTIAAAIISALGSNAAAHRIWKS